MRSLTNKLDEILLLVSRAYPDICVFTESWLHSDIPDSALSVPNYFIVRKDRDSNGGGIICYFSDKFQSHAMRILTSCDIPSIGTCGSELLPIIVSNLVVIVVYHPYWNNFAMHMQCIECLTDILDYVFSSVLDIHNSKIIICGDFNDLRNYYTEIASLSCCKPVVNFPTRGSNTLDQIFVNFLQDHPAQPVTPIGNSDHCSVLWNPFSSPQDKPASVKKKVRKLTKANLARFSTLLTSTDWLALTLSFENIDDAAFNFQESIRALFDFCFPERIVRRRINNPEWMKDSLRLLVDDRDRAYSMNQTSKYLRLRKEVSDHILHLKKVFLQKATSSKNSKKLWKSLSTLARIPKKNSSCKFAPVDFVNYFSSVFNSSSSSSRQTVVPENIPIFSFSDIIFQIRKLKNHSYGSDGIPGWIFKRFADFLSPAIVSLFNRCLAEGTFPRCFKMANILPVPKCARPMRVADFRPISILPTLSKLFERILVNKLILPSVRDKVSSTQFAFIPRSGSGTVSALTLAQHNILSYLDRSSGAVRVLSVDLRKAFDKVPHHIVLEACLNFNMSSSLFNIISSFLSDRLQRVLVNGVFSDWSSVSSGVPQGSVLGPILFTLATDSFSPVCTNSTVIRYADDILLLHFVRNSADDSLQVEWNNLVQWSSNLMIPINENKSHVMNIVTKSQLALPSVVVSPDSHLRSVDHFTFLGVVLSSDMKWKRHIDFTVSKASKRLFIIRNLRKAGCPPALLFRCYTAFIRSLLSYSFPCFCNLPDCLLTKLLRIERRVLRIVGNVDPSENLSSFLHRSCLKLFSAITHHSDHPLRVMFDSSHSRSVRNTSAFRPPFAKTKRFSNSFIKYASIHSI